MPGKLKRSLGLGECIFFGVGSILGAGIYTLIGKVAGFAGNMTWLAFLIASFTALLTAFSYAELSSAFPKAGGEYVYAKNTFGKKMGLTLGLIIAVNGIVSGATVAVGFGGYLIELIPMELLIATSAIILLVFFVNAIGIRESSTVNIIFTLIEAGGLAFVLISAYNSIGEVNLLELPEGRKSSLLMAAALSFFAFIGFEEIVKLAEETKNPQKNIPKALFIACGIVAVVYTCIAISVVSALPWSKLSESENPLTDVVSQNYGVTGGVIISVIALFSTTNTILSNMLGSSRVILDISRETKSLELFSKVSGKTKTPVIALILITIVMIAFAMIGRIEIIAMIANMFIFITFLFVNLAVIILRKKKPDIKRGFTIPFTVNQIPVISVLGVVMTLLLLGFNIYALATTGLTD